MAALALNYDELRAFWSGKHDHSIGEQKAKISTMFRHPASEFVPSVFGYIVAV